MIAAVQAPEPFSVPERAQEQEPSCSWPGYRKSSGTMPEQEPEQTSVLPGPERTSGLPGLEPRHAGPGQELPNGPTEAGPHAWLPEQGLPGEPAPFSEQEHGAAEVRYAAEN